MPDGWHADRSWRSWGPADRSMAGGAGQVARGSHLGARGAEWGTRIGAGWQPRHRAPGPDPNKAGRGPPRAHADTEQRSPESRAPTQRAPKSAELRYRNSLQTYPDRARRSLIERAPGPDTKSVGARHKERRSPRRAPTQGAPDPDTKRRAPGPDTNSAGPGHRAPGRDTNKVGGLPGPNTDRDRKHLGRHTDRRDLPDARSARPRHKARRAPTVRRRAGPRHADGAPRPDTRARHSEGTKRSVGPRHRAPGPNRKSPERRPPGPDTKSAGPDTKSAGPRHKECRAPTDRASGPDRKSAGPLHTDRWASTDRQ